MKGRGVKKIEIRDSIRGKFILSYLAVALIVVGFVIVFIYLNSGQSLMSLVVEQETAALKASVLAYYQEYGTLEGFWMANRGFGGPGGGPPPDEGPDMHGDFRAGNLRGLCGLVDAEGKVILPLDGAGPGETVPEEFLKYAIEVEAGGRTIARIVPERKREFKLSSEEELYLNRMTKAVALAGLSGAALAIFLGVLISSGILKPIRRLTLASKALAAGDLSQNVEITSKDELGQLTETFNRMSADLARVDSQRKRLTADITHDLSTPLQIISGYIEMVEDETIQLTPQRIRIIKTELDHLRRLVSDLTTLSQAEGGGLTLQPEPIQPAELLDQLYSTYQPIAAGQGVTMRFADGGGAPLTADPGRLRQTIQNLVENALRYTLRGGEITLSLQTEAGRVKIAVTDTGSGIDPADIPYVFDRFYRVDPARDANAGKMGLGLSICRALTVAQGGTIAVRSAGKGKGTTFELSFPADRRSAGERKLYGE